VTRGELAAVLRTLDRKRWSKARIDKLLDIVDLNGDGYIQFEEFVAWAFGCTDDSIFSPEVKESAKLRVQALFRVAYGAAKAGNFAHVIRLVSTSPDPYVILSMHKGVSGFTILHSAAAQGQLRAVRQLLCFGADPSLKSSSGQTPSQVALEADHQDAHSILDRVEGIWGACNLRDLRLLKAFYDGDGFTMEAVLQRGTVDIRKILPTGLSLLDLARITPSKVSTAILEFDQKDPMPELPQQVCALCKTPREKHEQFREHPLDVCSTCVQKLRLERRASDFPENRQSILAWEDQAMAKSKPKPGGLPRKANDMANEFWVEGAIQVLVRQTSNDVEIAQLAHPFMHVAGCGWIGPV